MRLYELPLDRVTAIVHRQSVVHSLVEFCDGAVLAQLGSPDMKRGEVLDTFQTFVDPERALPGKIIDLTGITDAMLRGAPKIGEILPDFLKFCGNRPLCAHNADFDVGFVTAACERLSIPFQPTYADTLILAQNLMEQAQ